jgi:alkylation response protein AidB-like acyl-CoA dehydrogenase
MDLDFTEEQNMLRDTTRSICEQVYSLPAVRACEKEAPGYPQAFWQALVESGLTGLLVDEQFGGAGMGMLDAVVVFEELGRNLAFSPLLESCVLATAAIDKFAGAEQKQAALQAVVAGDWRIAVAQLAPGADYDVSSLGLAADGEKLNATRHLVPFADSATHILLVDASTCYLLPVAAAGISMQAQENMASLPMSVVRFENVDIADAQRFNHDGRWDEVAGVVALMASAMAAGGAERMLDITAEYSKTRVQFGKPIGAFQSLSHYMAELATDIEGSKTLNYHAAWAFDEQRDWSLLAAQAKLHAGDCFRQTTAVGTQIHGGLGFTREADAQLYYRRAKWLQLMYWDAEFLERRIADLLLAA